MKVKLEGLTLMADDVARLGRFYHEVIGFDYVVNDSHYVEFNSQGIRLAICSKSLMADNTNGHISFIESRKGQAVELNFECASPEEVIETYREFVAKGATDIAAPKSMPWGHTTGFFADPEGNIHSIFAVNPAEAD